MSQSMEGPLLPGSNMLGMAHVDMADYAQPNSLVVPDA